MKKGTKKTLNKNRVTIKSKKSNQNLWTTLIIVCVFLIFTLTFIIINKNKKSAEIDTSTSLSTLNSDFIIVKDKDGKHEYKIPLKPAMAKSLGLPATPVTPAITITTQQNQTTTATTTTEEEKKDFSYLFTPVESKEKIHRIDIEEAKFLYDSGKAIFIDARALNEYEESHIKSAISIPVNMMMENIPKYKDKLKNKVLVTYCHGIGCHLSDRVAYTLFDNGYRKICIFFSGWPKWVEHNYPIEKK